eukprot:5964014-Pyramimonas_sp.AAC.1
MCASRPGPTFPRRPSRLVDLDGPIWSRRAAPTAIKWRCWPTSVDRTCGSGYDGAGGAPVSEISEGGRLHEQHI